MIWSGSCQAQYFVVFSFMLAINRSHIPETSFFSFFCFNVVDEHYWRQSWQNLKKRKNQNQVIKHVCSVEVVSQTPGDSDIQYDQHDLPPTNKITHRTHRVHSGSWSYLLDMSAAASQELYNRSLGYGVIIALSSTALFLVLKIYCSIAQCTPDLRKCKRDKKSRYESPEDEILFV